MMGTCQKGTWNFGLRVRHLCNFKYSAEDLRIKKERRVTLQWRALADATFVISVKFKITCHLTGHNERNTA